MASSPRYFHLSQSPFIFMKPHSVKRARSKQSKEAHEARRIARRQEEARAWVCRAQGGDFSLPPKDANGIKYIKENHPNLWTYVMKAAAGSEYLQPAETNQARDIPASQSRHVDSFVVRFRFRNYNSHSLTSRSPFQLTIKSTCMSGQSSSSLKAHHDALSPSRMLIAVRTHQKIMVTPSTRLRLWFRNPLAGLLLDTQRATGRNLARSLIATMNIQPKRQLFHAKIAVNLRLIVPKLLHTGHYYVDQPPPGRHGSRSSSSIVEIVQCMLQGKRTTSEKDLTVSKIPMPCCGMTFVSSIWRDKAEHHDG